MQKAIKYPITLIIIFFMLSFTSTSHKIQTIPAYGMVRWKGYKLTGFHQGNISIKKGSLEFDKEVLVGGYFEIDMTTIKCTDLQGEAKKKIENYLNSKNLFNIKKFPKSTLIFKEVKCVSENSYNVTGLITIREKTAVINFIISLFPNKAKAKLKIDRMKFGVFDTSKSFFNKLKDKAIYDEFDLIADIVF